MTAKWLAWACMRQKMREDERFLYALCVQAFSKIYLNIWRMAIANLCIQNKTKSEHCASLPFEIRCIELQFKISRSFLNLLIGRSQLLEVGSDQSELLLLAHFNSNTMTSYDVTNWKIADSRIAERRLPRRMSLFLKKIELDGSITAHNCLWN